MLEYIVTGTGRCGTVSVAICLSRSGVKCGHEKIFTIEGLEGTEIKRPSSGISEFDSNFVDYDEVVADSSYMAAPFLSNFSESTIIHLIRHPFQVIYSFLNKLCYFRYETSPTDPYEIFISKYIPELVDMSPIDRACYYYIRWNNMIESSRVKQYIRHKIEDGYQTLLKKLELPINDYDDRECNAWKRWPVYSNYTSFSDVTLENITKSNFANELKEISIRYGYDLYNVEEPPIKTLNYPAILSGKWKHGCGENLREVVFCENGRLNAPNSPDTWDIEGDKLTLRWLGEKDIQTCTLTTGKYKGVNKHGLEVIGRRIENCGFHGCMP